jgi:hypothetical protein
VSAAAAGSGVTRAPSRNATKCTQVAWPGLARARFSATGPPKSVPARRSRRLCMRWYRLFLSPPRCGARAPCRCRASRVCAPGLGDARPRARTAACVRGAERGAVRANPRTGGTRASVQVLCVLCCAPAPTFQEQDGARHGGGKGLSIVAMVELAGRRVGKREKGKGSRAAPVPVVGVVRGRRHLHSTPDLPLCAAPRAHACM